MEARFPTAQKCRNAWTPSWEVRLREQSSHGYSCPACHLWPQETLRFPWTIQVPYDSRDFVFLSSVLFIIWCVGMASTKVCAQDFSHRLLWVTKGCWESNHSPLEEQPTLLNSAISPHWCEEFWKLSAIIKDSCLTHLLSGALGENN